jgi:hypothetical protein
MALGASMCLTWANLQVLLAFVMAPLLLSWSPLPCLLLVSPPRLAVPRHWRCKSPIGRQGVGGPLDRLYSSKPSELIGNARTRGTHGLGQYTWHTRKFIASKFVSCLDTSYNKHKHVLLNICIQFYNYQHPLRISLLKTCSEGTQFFIKRTFYSQDTFCKSCSTCHSSSVQCITCKAKRNMNSNIEKKSINTMRRLRHCLVISKMA